MYLSVSRNLERIAAQNGSAWASWLIGVAARCSSSSGPRAKPAVALPSVRRKSRLFIQTPAQEASPSLVLVLVLDLVLLLQFAALTVRRKTRSRTED